MRTLIALLLAAASLCAQQIPTGTLLPSMLDNTIDSDRSKPGEAISAKLRQDVPLPDGGKIKRDSRILGHVVAVVPASAGHPARVSIQFDHIVVDKEQFAAQIGLRALASMEAVAAAREPVNANSGLGTSVWDWNMVQVGGQAVFNGQRIVKSQTGQVVGRVPEPGAVLAVPMANPQRGCAGASSDTAEQAFWIFSTDACGVYGYKDLTISGAGNGAASAAIVLRSPKRITVRDGSGLLLEVK
ncbi:MAG TPA: hypothetical protein VMU45_02940 [Candidatus Eisenbacteria bacterium]|nr:hypothetical protein [Candidatus Eisenbacteria bacterium]